MEQSIKTIKKLEQRFNKYGKGIPVSLLGIKSWGTVDYANKIGYLILLDWTR